MTSWNRYRATAPQVCGGSDPPPHQVQQPRSGPDSRNGPSSCPVDSGRPGQQGFALSGRSRGAVWSGLGRDGVGRDGVGRSRGGDGGPAAGPLARVLHQVEQRSIREEHHIGRGPGHPRAAPSGAARCRGRLGEGRCRAPGEQQRGRQQEHAGQADGRTRAEQAAQRPPDGRQRGGRSLGRHRPGGQRAGDPVGGGALKAVGGVDGVEDPAAEDEPQFDTDHQQQPSGAGPPGRPGRRARARAAPRPRSGPGTARTG